MSSGAPCQRGPHSTIGLASDPSGHSCAAPFTELPSNHKGRRAESPAEGFRTTMGNRPIRNKALLVRPGAGLSIRAPFAAGFAELATDEGPNSVSRITVHGSRFAPHAPVKTPGRLFLRRSSQSSTCAAAPRPPASRKAFVQGLLQAAHGHVELMGARSRPAAYRRTS